MTSNKYDEYLSGNLNRSLDYDELDYGKKIFWKRFLDFYGHRIFSDEEARDVFVFGHGNRAVFVGYVGSTTVGKRIRSRYINRGKGQFPEAEKLSSKQGYSYSSPSEDRSIDIEYMKNHIADMWVMVIGGIEGKSSAELRDFLVGYYETYSKGDNPGLNQRRYVCKPR